MSGYFKITIVTPSYNQGAFIEETIDSILSQSYPNLEYMIIDGGSTDNTLEIIKKYEKHINYWVSEKDDGQSHAINKGLNKMTGELFNWINSDDILLPNSLEKVNEVFQKNDVLCFKGRLKHIKENQLINFELNHSKNEKLMCWLDPVVNQQSTFYHKKAISLMGPLSNDLHYSMDYEWWIKYLILFGIEKAEFDQNYLAGFRLHGDSKTMSDSYIFQRDIANILHSLCLQLKLEKYSDLLATAYEIYPSYKLKVSKLSIDKELAEKMVIYFIFKWNRWSVNSIQRKTIRKILNLVDNRELGFLKSNWKNEAIENAKLLSYWKRKIGF